MSDDVNAEMVIVDFKKDIRPDNENANRHTERGDFMVGESVTEFGVGEAGTLDKNGNVIGGNLRTEKFAQVLDPEKAIVIKTDGKTPVYLQRTDIDLDTETGRRLAYALNRTAQISIDFDPSQIEADMQAGIDLTDFFFEDEIEAILEDADRLTTIEMMKDRQDAAVDINEEVLNSLAEKWGTDDGQRWRVGDHAIYCGDATSADDVTELLQGAKPVLMTTDPPYGVSYDPSWRAKAGINKNTMRLGVVNADNRWDWTEAYDLFPGTVAYVWHSGKFAGNVQSHLELVGFEIVSQIIWKKDRFALSGSDYHWHHESCWYAVKAGENHNWNGDRSQSTIWEINRNDDMGHGHSTQKPLETYLRPIQNSSRKGEAIYDPFGGSGTAMVAGENLGRPAYLMEIDPRYVAVTLERFSTAFPDVKIELEQ